MSDKIFVLPFDAYVDEFLELVRRNQVVILAAETGAGKSTKAPLALLNAGLGGNKLIGVSEPRRPAATLLAKWVAELHGTEFGTVVGYQIGQDKQISKESELVFLTEGVLLNQLHSDPLLSHYGIICLDEVHERGVNQDLLMALVKSVLPKRPDLKVVVMSATIDTDKFAKYFGNAPVLTVPGRVFPVAVRYAEDTPNAGRMVDAMIEKILEILHGNEPGDILAFLPDQASITQVVSKLEKEKERELSRYRFLPLYGSQAPDDQAEVFKVDGRRRIIVATNIAETSLTIDGVRHVVDSGQIKATVYVDANMSALQVTEHSQAGCNQRKGRAGRTQNGICHRLFCEADFESRVAFTKPEILSMSLDQVLLDLRCLKYTLAEILSLDLMDAPKTQQWKDAEKRLKMLGAIGADGAVTEDGVRMKRFHVEPMIGRMILEGEKHGCLEEVITISACLAGTRPIFIRPKDRYAEADRAKKGFDDPNSDLLTLLKVWRQWDRTDGDYRWARENFLSSRALSQVDRMRDQLMRTLEREGVPYSSSKDELGLRKAVAAGLIVNIAQKSGRFNYSWNDRSTFVSPGSALFGDNPPQMLVCVKAMETTNDRGTKTYMHGCHAIEPSWLSELVPAEACAMEVNLEKDYVTRELQLKYRRTWNGIELEHKTLETIPEALIPFIAASVTKQLVDGYGYFCDNATQLVKLWKQIVPSVPWSVFGEERTKRIQPFAETFAKAIAKKIAGLPTIRLVLAAIESVIAEDVLMGDALKAYQIEHEAEMRRDREMIAERARREEETRKANEKAQAEFAPLREEFAALDARVRALGYVFDYSGGTRMDFRDNNQREIARRNVNSTYAYDLSTARYELQQYTAIVERLERANAPKFDLTRVIYAQVRAVMPVCPVCGGAWNDSFVCTQVHSPDQVIAKHGQNDWLIGEFKTDRDETVASVSIERRRTSVKLEFEVGENQAWSYKAFKFIAFNPNIIVLSPALVADREIILLWLAELEEAKRALEAELAFVADLKRKVTTGEVICLKFRDRGNGTMVADYKRELVEAPYGDDLSRYPSSGDSWWCHVIPGSGPTKIALYRKVGVTKVDVEKVLKDGLDMFPGLPSQLLQ
ncbi:MAG: helicase-related protein [Candidatus Uhrbacteria bacterium]|nr:helicase-related protein [Candidatus Uhrbacteria bacterium]